MENGLTFVFENDRAYAIREGKVVDAANSAEELEVRLADRAHTDEGWEERILDAENAKKEGDDAAASLEGEDEDEEKEDKESTVKEGAFIETPNGLKGKVLGRTQDLWNETVTVRLANGNIVHLPVIEDNIRVAAAEEGEVRSTPIESLRERLVAPVDGTRESLVARREELKSIRREAGVHIADGVALSDAQQLDEIATQADVERRQVDDGLAGLDEAEAITPPEHTYHAAPVQSYGPDSGWLENTADQMISEAENTDYDKLMDEGPEAFVADLPDTSIADQGVTHSMASRYIRSKTAGAKEEVRGKYEQVWLTRVEEVRRDVLANRKGEQRKQAAVEQETESNTLDEGLFLS